MKNTLSIVALSVALGTSGIASAEEAVVAGGGLDFKVRGDVGVTAYELEVIAGDDIGGTEEVDLTTYALGASIVSNSLVFDVEYKGTADSDDHSYFGDQFDKDVDRSEVTGTVGYIVAPFVIFAGYKTAETTFNFEYDMDFSPLTETVYDTSGAFFGASYNTKLADTWSLSVSGAYSLLESEYSDDWDDLEYDYESDDGTGFSLSAQVSNRITDSLSWYVKADYQSYTYDGWEDKSDFGFGDIDGETEESFTRLSIGLRY